MIEWWTTQQTQMIGAIGGSLVGVVGGGLGSLVGVCAPRGLLKTPVIAMQMLLILAGAALLGAGVYASLSHQPQHVYYPLMLAGSILVGSLGGLFPITLWAYRAAAARRHIRPTPGVDVRAPSPAFVHAVIECWDKGGRLRVLALRIGAVMLVIALGAAASATVLAVRGEPVGVWSAWAWAAFGPAFAAVMCRMMPRAFLAAASNARAMLDQQRLAAEELRRG